MKVSLVYCAIFTFLADEVLSAPQYPTVCTTKTKYRNLTQGEPYARPQELVSGVLCEIGAGCTHQAGVEHTVGVAISIEGSLSGGLDLKKIFSLGLSAGFSYEWSTSDTTAVSTQVTCFPGTYECGLQVATWVVKITGEATTYKEGFQCPESALDIWTPWSIEAPYYIASQGPNHASMQKNVFSTCFTTCSYEKGGCKAVVVGGVSPCPGVLQPCVLNTIGKELHVGKGGIVPEKNPYCDADGKPI